MSRIRNLELIFNLVKDQIKSKQDCVVAALHCLLINEELKCVGVGEEFSDEDAKSSTELLPEQWNNNQEIYSLRYISKDAKKRYLIKIVTAGNIIHICIGLYNTDKTAAMSANIDKLISDDFNDYSSAYKDLDSLKNAFQKDIVEKLLSNPSKASSSKPTSSRLSPQILGPSVPRPRMPIPPDFENNAPFSGVPRPFPDIGSRDLDPLGRGSGGMLLDPSYFRAPRGGRIPYGPPPGLPRGSVPPGARFDPYGPPSRGLNRPGPNPDHFKPPDFEDEFF